MASHFTRQIYGSGYGGKSTLRLLQDRDLSVMNSSTSRLNDNCLDGAAQILLLLHSEQRSPYKESSSRCSIFSTQDLPLVRFNAGDDVFWRRTRLAQYWKKDIWLLPIHRVAVQHWVLAIILPHHRQIFLFDSFAEIRPWRRELKEIMQFITRLTILANKNGHSLQVVTEEGWSANILSKEGLQTNGYDCGLWVLAVISAVLEGYHCTALQEVDMNVFRGLLYHHMLALPGRS